MFKTIDSIAARSEALWLLLGRVLIGVLYVPSGFGKLSNLSGFSGVLASKGLPAPIAWAVVGALVEFLGGIALIVGFRTRAIAVLMIVFTLFAIFLSHNYWDMVDAARAANRIQFFKNLAIIGGLLYVFVRGAGPWSVDRSS
jgi:putative oxidoreductase